MAKAVWHHTDRKTGARTEVWLDATEQEIDARCVQNFESLQIDVSQDKFPSKAQLNADVRVGLVLADADKLPPLKRQHWLDELTRIGAKVPAPTPPKEEKPAKPKQSEG